MEQYSKPTRLIPLQLYSPFQNTAPFRRLISRDQERLRARSFKNISAQSTKNQNRPENVMSFARLYSQPALVFTSLHERQILGRVRKPKNLPPLSKTQYDSRFPKTTEAKEVDRRAYSLELSRNSSQSDIIDAKWVGLETHKSEKAIEFLPDSELIEEAAENQESELIMENPENHDPVIKAEESGNFNFFEDKELEEDFKALKINNIETVDGDNKFEDFGTNENQAKEADKGEGVVVPKLNLQIEHRPQDGEEAATPLLTPLSMPKIQIIEEHQEARTVAENSSLIYEAPGVILKLNSMRIAVEGVDYELKLSLALLKHVMFGTELDIIVNITTSVFIGNNQLTFMKKENYLTSYAEVSANNMQIIFQPDFQRSFLLLKPGAIKGKMIGKIIKRLELAGLVIKASKMVKPSNLNVQEFYKDSKDDKNYEKLVKDLSEGPVVVMIWEGSNAILVCKKIIQAIEDTLSLDSPLKSSFYSPGNLKDTEKQLSIWFSSEERQVWDYHKNPRIIKAGQAKYAWVIKLPTIEYITIGKSIIRPIPLGILKQMIDSHFDKWNEKWMTYFKSHEIEDKSPKAKRSGADTSSLKANTTHNERTVILSLNAPEVIMRNHEIEAKYIFKIEDISSLLAIVDENGNDFLEALMIGCKLSSSEIRRKKVWKLKLAIDTLEFTGTKNHKLDSHAADIDIDGTIYNCRFIMPSVEIYDPETKYHDQIYLDSEKCQKLVLENFNDWEKTCLNYFDEKNKIDSKPHEIENKPQEAKQSEIDKKAKQSEIDKKSKQTEIDQKAKQSEIDKRLLKANTVWNEKKVILSLIAPEVITSNHELEAKYVFKIEDISSLLATVDAKGKDFLKVLMASSKLLFSKKNKKNPWRLKIATKTLKFTGMKKQKLEPLIANISIKKIPYNCQFIMPSVDVYDLETKHHNRIPLDNETCEKLALENFNNWESTCLHYFGKKNQTDSKPHEIENKPKTDERLLKANIVHSEKKVIVSLIAPEVIMSNHELEAKYVFKIEDISSLLAIADKKGKDFLKILMAGSKLLFSKNRKKNPWKLKIKIKAFEFTGMKKHKLEPHIANIDIDGALYNCQFIMPSVDVYDLETKRHNRIPLDNETCEKLVLEDFNNWKNICLDYFDLSTDLNWLWREN